MPRRLGDMGAASSTGRNLLPTYLWREADTISRYDDLRLLQEPKNLKTCTKNRGWGVRKTRCSHYARRTTTATHMFVSTRVSVDSVARATRRCVGAHRVRCAPAADGHLRALRASTLSHTVRGAVVCAREVAVVCRRFYYVPMIITPPPRY